MAKFRLVLLSILAASLIQAADSNPAVSIQIYSDFQCPYCGRFAPAVRELQTKGIEGIPTKIEFKNFPLGFHAFAQLAAQAALAASEQGKFWEMHDLLFANQSALTRDDLLKYARKLDIDMPRFQSDLDSEAIRKRVEADKVDGAAKNVQGTPTFFINGKEYSGTKTFPELAGLIKADVGRQIIAREMTDALMAKGPTDAPVKIEFFADLESPVSRSANYVLEEVLGEHGNQVQVQFRNYPLSFHPEATLVHDAAMTAAREGHFWQMVNFIFDHQETVKEQDLIAYAGKLGMDQEKFANALRTKRYSPRIDVDLADGFQRGVRGSPVIFVNGKRIDGVPSLKDLNGYVEAALTAKTAAIAVKPVSAQ